MNVLVTGGSGFLGRQVMTDLAKRYPGGRLRMLDRNEDTVRMCLDLVDAEVVMGDIRDEEIVKRAVKDMDAVIHLAAMKHIDFCQNNPGEAASINVAGASNLLRSFMGETFLAMSTDKAAVPSNVYGYTKKLMENLVLEKAGWSEGRYMVARSGNIFASSGSVIEKWQRLLETQNKITVTDPGMTRYFITVEELSGYLLWVLESGENGGIYIPTMKSIRLSDLAQAVIDVYGKPDSQIEYTGVRVGEKMHENVFTQGENVFTKLSGESSEHNERMGVDEIVRLLKYEP